MPPAGSSPRSRAGGSGNTPFGPQARSERSTRCDPSKLPGVRAHPCDGCDVDGMRQKHPARLHSATTLCNGEIGPGRVHKDRTGASRERTLRRFRSR